MNRQQTTSETTCRKGIGVSSAESRLSYCALCLALAVVAFSGVTRAEEEKKPGDTSGQAEKKDPKEELPQVTVIAERQAEKVERSATSVSVLTRTEITDRVISSTEHVPDYIPNFDVRQTIDRRSPAYSVRGFANPTGFGQPTVITYVDDIPNGDIRGLNEELFDVEYVEAFRGAQPTRFGRNAPAGAIYFRTVEPTNKFTGEADLRYGNYDTQYFRGIVRGPILKDLLHFKLAGAFSRRDGYLKNRVRGNRPDHQKALDGKAQLFWRPIKDLRITLTATAQDADDGAQGYVDYDSRDHHELTNDQRGAQEIDAYLGSLRIEYAAPWFDFTSISTRRRFEADHSRTDGDLTPVNVLDFKEEYTYIQWSQEFRFAARNPDGPWDWHAGLYFEDRSVQTIAGAVYLNTAIIQAPPPFGFGLPFTAPAQDVHNSDRHNKTYAVFGDATYTALKKLDITFGMRYEAHKPEILRTHFLQAPVEGANVEVVPTINEEKTNHAVLPRLAVAYRVTDDLIPYMSITRGWRPGGYTQGGDSVAAAEWDPEFSWQYEAGLKSWWLDRKIAFSAALFWNDIKDYHVRRFFTPTSFGLVNAHEVTARGFEVEVEARPLEGLNVQFHFGFTDAHFDRFTDKVNGGTFDDNRVLNVPRYDFMLAAQYRHSTGFFGRLEWTGLGEYEMREDNTLKQGAFEVLNAKLGYERDFFGIYLYGRNLLNRDYDQYTLPGIVPGQFVTAPGAPQTFGIMARFKF